MTFLITQAESIQARSKGRYLMNIIFLLSLSLQVAEIKIPHSYTDQQGNYGSDIAILLLNSSLQFSELLQPICVDWEEKLDFSDNSVGKVGSSKETLPLFFAVNRNFLSSVHHFL